MTRASAAIRTLEGLAARLFSLKLYRGGVFATTIASSTASDGSFTWTVPTDLQENDNYEGDLKVFKDDENVSEKIGDYEITGDGLKKILDTIDTF